ncbi:MAG: hypothetical protein KF752_08020 [Pirellulaceae bacterium]|nr:hypothetical protein [Pirellulaceae bacterium]
MPESRDRKENAMADRNNCQSSREQLRQRDSDEPRVRLTITSTLLLEVTVLAAESSTAFEYEPDFIEYDSPVINYRRLASRTKNRSFYTLG